MGYCTAYKLTVHVPQGEPVNEKAILAELKKKNTPERDAELLNQLKHQPVTARSIIQELRETNPDAKHAITDTGAINNSCTWYNHDVDMYCFSMKYPSVLFELSGEGDEASDLWKSYYKNGKTQHCKAELTFPPFDEEKLA